MLAVVSLFQKSPPSYFQILATRLIEGQEFSTVIPALALRKSQVLKLSLVFYLLAERLSMFSAKLNAFESLFLVCIFLRYQ